MTLRPQHGGFMRSFLVALAASLISFSSMADGNFPPSFDSAAWSTLMGKVVETGSKMQTDDGWILYLSRVIPNDPTVPRKADYLTARGVYVNNRFVTFSVNTVTEIWTIDADNNWNIDQIIRRISPEGALQSVYHSVLVEDQRGFIISSKVIPSGAPSSPEELQAWGEKLKDWLN